MTEEIEEDDYVEPPRVPEPSWEDKGKVFRKFMYELYVARGWTMNVPMVKKLFNLLDSWGWSHNWGNGELDNDQEVAKQFWEIKEFLDNPKDWPRDEPPRP